MGWVLFWVCVSQLQILLCLHHKPLVNLAVNGWQLQLNFEIVSLNHNLCQDLWSNVNFICTITLPIPHTILTCGYHMFLHALLSSSYYYGNSHVDTTQCS